MADPLDQIKPVKQSDALEGLKPAGGADPLDQVKPKAAKLPSAGDIFNTAVSSITGTIHDAALSPFLGLYADKQAIESLPSSVVKDTKAAASRVGEDISHLTEPGPVSKWLGFDKPGLVSTALGAGKTALDTAALAFTPMETVGRETIGKAAEKMSGGRIPAEVGGAFATLAVPPGALARGVTELPKIFSETKLGGWLKDVFAPTLKSEEAAKTGRIISAETGVMAHENELARKGMEAHEKLIGALPDQQKLDFIDNIENGRPQTNPSLQPLSDVMRKGYDHVFDQIKHMGLDEKVGFIENYFPHIWKDPAKAEQVFAGVAKRPLEGSKGFTRERTIPTIKEGIDAGLEPVTTNPIELTMRYMQQANKYLAGQAIFRSMKDEGLAKFVRSGDRAPEGWAKIDDPIARPKRPVVEEGSPEGAKPVYAPVGEYYAPKDAAQVINNHLSPGFQGPAKSAYDVIRYGGNSLNMAQLGLSLYHLVFTSMDNMASGAGLGIKQLFEGVTQGNIPRALRGVGQVAKSVQPARPVMNYLTGKKLLNAYLNPDGVHPEMQKIVDSLIQGGGRVRMDEFYRGTPAGSFWRALRVGTAGQEIKQAFKELGPVKGAASFIGRSLQTVMAPLMEDIVPKQKLGVFSEMARDALRKNPGMGQDEVRQTMQQIWSHVDNRMGELVYDNLFWNKFLKQTLMAGVRAVGWNLGTIREVGGGLLDLPKIIGNREMTNKASYILGAVGTLALYGSIYQYLKTGKAPESTADLFMPRTGGTNKDGTPERVMIPSYMKDVLDVAHDPLQTAVNKMNPLWGSLQEMATNRDFYGAMIVNPGDPAMKQLEDGAKWLGQQYTPFSFRGAPGGKNEDTAISPVEKVLGLNPPPRKINPDVEPHMTMEQRRALRKKLMEEEQSQ